MELHAELWDGVSFSRSRLFLGGIALLAWSGFVDRVF